MSEQEVAIQLGILVGKMDAMETNLSLLQKDTSDLRALANRWRGAFIVILALGAVGGFLTDKLWAIWLR